MAGARQSLLTKANWAPLEIASSMYSWPSTFEPTNATKNVLFVALFELITGIAEVICFPSELITSPSTISAI